MLGPSSRRSGLRQRPRPMPVAMEVEESLPRSMSKDRLARKFGTNLMNEAPRSSLARLPQKFSLRNGKPNSRRTYRREGVDSHPKEIILLEAVQPKNETSLYESSINSLLRTNQEASSFRTDFISLQREVDAGMRCELIGWLVEVATQFQLKSETLFMCVNLIDRYLSKDQVLKSWFQLLGISSLFIASKYEEIYPPHLTKFVGIALGKTKHELLEMESRIILLLDFNLISCTALRLLDMWCLQTSDVSPKNRVFAQYLLELALLDYRMCHYRPSSQALASLCLSASFLEGRHIEPHHLGLQIDLSVPLTELKHCFTQLLEVYGQRNCQRFQGVRTRFSKQSHFDASLY